MLKTLFSESMMDMSNNPHTKGVDNIPYSLFDGRQSNSLPDSRRRRQMRSCDLCRRGKRACDAVKTIQSCSNCVRKNQACTFNWLKTRSDCQNSRARKRVYSSLQNSGSYTQGYATQCHGCQCEALVEPAADSSRCNSSERGNIRPLSQGKTGQGGYHFNIAPIQDADNGSNDSTLLEGLETAQWSENTCNRSEASFCRSNWKHDGPNALRDTILVQKTSQGFVADGLLRIYNDSMENALSCWLTEHNCPYTMQSYEPSILSATKIKQEWGSSWSNRMYNRVIRLDRAYKSLHIRELTSAEEITVSEALNMSVVAFASQWAQAGERGARCRPTEACLKTGEFPQFNDFERSMQEDLWHRTSQLLLRAASIDSFRVVFALIIFSLTQRPLDVTRPLPRTTDKVRTHYEHFKALLQDDDAPIFLELALRQILAQRRRLERFERDMPRRGDNEPTDPLRREDRDTFNMLYWLGIMFDTLSAAICHRAVVVNDEDCELPQPETLECTESPVVAVSHNILSDQFPVFGHNGHFFANSCSIEGPQEHEVWGGLFTQKRTSQLDHSVTRWPCSYKLAASTLSSAAPVKVLLFRRVAHLETLVSRKAPPTRIESAIDAAFQVYNHWNCTYNPFITDCVANHSSLPTRVQSWYVLLAGHWYLGTFLLSDLLATIDANLLSSPNERICRQASDLVAMLRKQNALAVADLSLASIHNSTQGESFGDFHFALNQAAHLTEPWTVVFVRSLCRAGYVLVQIAASNPSEEERDQARRRCGDCIEGLWYLGRKSDMAFLAARGLSHLLDEANVNTPARTMFQEERGGWAMMDSYQRGIDPSSRNATEILGYIHTIDSTHYSDPSLVANITTNYQVGDDLLEREVLPF